MMSLNKACAAIAALSLGAQPCLAADLARNFSSAKTRTAAFAGLQLRLPFGQKNRTMPAVRLQLGPAYYAREQTGGYVQIYRTSGLEFGTGRSGSPALFIAGQDAVEMQAKLNIDGTTKTLLVVGGVLLAVAVLASVASGTPTAGPPEGAFD